MKGFVAGCSLAIALSMAPSAYAHHSAAGIDRTKSVTLVGTVKQFKWANPHSWMELDVPNDKGGISPDGPATGHELRGA